MSANSHKFPLGCLYQIRTMYNTDDCKICMYLCKLCHVFLYNNEERKGEGHILGVCAQQCGEQEGSLSLLCLLCKVLKALSFCNGFLSGEVWGDGGFC